MRIPVGLFQGCLDFLSTWIRHMWLRTPPPTLCPDHACIELQVLAVERLKSSIAFLLSSSYSKIIIKRLLETQTNPPFRQKKEKLSEQHFWAEKMATRRRKFWTNLFLHTKKNTTQVQVLQKQKGFSMFYTKKMRNHPSEVLASRLNPRKMMVIWKTPLIIWPNWNISPT